MTTILLVIATVVFGLALISRSDHGLFSWIVRHEQRGGSLTTLNEMRDMARLETLAYVQRTVFPHDFLQPHLTVPDLLRKIAAAGTTAADALNPEELAHLRAANLATLLNLASTRDDSRFVVITTTMLFGYDLETVAEQLETVLNQHREEPPGEEPPQYVMPPPLVLTVITENINRANYPFPAIPLDAEGWRQVTSFVEDHVTVSAPMHELSRSASRNGRDALYALMGKSESEIRILLP